jgi:hypothetical protein
MGVRRKLIGANRTASRSMTDSRRRLSRRHDEQRDRAHAVHGRNFASGHNADVARSCSVILSPAARGHRHLWRQQARNGLCQPHLAAPAQRCARVAASSGRGRRPAPLARRRRTQSPRPPTARPPNPAGAGSSGRNVMRSSLLLTSTQALSEVILRAAPARHRPQDTLDARPKERNLGPRTRPYPNDDIEAGPGPPGVIYGGSSGSCPGRTFASVVQGRRKSCWSA